MQSFAVWRDTGGRFSVLKVVVLVVAAWPAAWLVARFAMHDLGGRPVTELIHGFGDWTVRFLLATLAVTPLRAVLDWPRVVQLRRMLGVTTACYAGCHFLLYCVDQKWQMLIVAREIVLRFYLTIGFVALLGLLTLAITSTDSWQKTLRGRWKKLHRLVFPIAVLGLFHYYLQSKADVTDAVIATGVFAWLMLWRAAPRRWQTKLWLPMVLALAAPLLTALAETAWYELATGVKASRVLLSNLDIAFGLRPAVQILVAGVILAALAMGRRLVKMVGLRFTPANRAKVRPT